jgi:hypothetical protein
MNVGNNYHSVYIDGLSAKCLEKRTIYASRKLNKPLILICLAKALAEEDIT